MDKKWSSTIIGGSLADAEWAIAACKKSVAPAQPDAGCAKGELKSILRVSCPVLTLWLTGRAFENHLDTSASAEVFRSETFPSNDKGRRLRAFKQRAARLGWPP